jgi:hypothetical protein
VKLTLIVATKIVFQAELVVWLQRFLLLLLLLLLLVVLLNDL